MINSTQLRNIIVEKLKEDNYFNSIVTAELDGTYISAVDIAFPKNNEDYEIYRIAVIRHS